MSSIELTYIDPELALYVTSGTLDDIRSCPVCGSDNFGLEHCDWTIGNSMCAARYNCMYCEREIAVVDSVFASQVHRKARGVLRAEVERVSDIHATARKKLQARIAELEAEVERLGRENRDAVDEIHAGMNMHPQKTTERVRNDSRASDDKTPPGEI